jgi:MraZ protein
MSSFYGGYVHSVDAKGRFSIPSQIRNGLSEFARNTFVVLPGPDGCLAAYPLDEWQDREKFMRSFPEADVSRYYMRIALRRARHCRMDGHKRILIPPDLLATVDIRDSVLIIGQLDHIEFWDPVKYEEYEKSRGITPEEALEEITRRMTDRGSARDRDAR